MITRKSRASCFQKKQASSSRPSAAPLCPATPRSSWAVPVLSPSRELGARGGTASPRARDSTALDEPASEVARLTRPRTFGAALCSLSPTHPVSPVCVFPSQVPTSQHQRDGPLEGSCALSVGPRAQCTTGGRRRDGCLEGRRCSPNQLASSHGRLLLHRQQSISLFGLRVGRKARSSPLQSKVWVRAKRMEGREGEREIGAHCWGVGAVRARIPPAPRPRPFGGGEATNRVRTRAPRPPSEPPRKTRGGLGWGRAAGSWEKQEGRTHTQEKMQMPPGRMERGCASLPLHRFCTARALWAPGGKRRGADARQKRRGAFLGEHQRASR